MLTQLLRDREDVANALAALVPPRDPAKPSLPLQVRPHTGNYALVGTAFDYLLRWEIERRNRKAKDREWVARTAVEKILPTLRDVPSDLPGVSTAAPGPIPNLSLSEVFRTVLKEATEFHDSWIHSIFPPDSRGTIASSGFGDMAGEPPDAMLGKAAQHVLTLAKIDPLFRSGKLDPEVNVYDEDDVRDVMELFRIVPWESLGCGPDSLARQVVPILNPDFGRVTQRFKGADADLVLEDGGIGGGILIDFKTTKYHDIEKHYAQLVGYAMIADEYRQEAPSFPEIVEAGIYFARHGETETFDFERVRGNPAYEAAREKLLDAADEMFGAKAKTGDVW